MRSNQVLSRLTVIVVAALVAPGCGSDDPTTPDPQPGSVDLQMVYAVDGATLVPHEMRYTNAAGNQYSVVRLRTLISNVELHATGGHTVEFEGPFYFTSEDPASLTRALGAVPAGTYDSISFTFGLDESMNVTNRFNGEAWHDDVQWPTPLGGGYHYMILDGFYADGDSTRTYNTHLGRVGTQMPAQPHFFEVSLSFDAISIDGSSHTIPLVMDVNEWYEDPNTYAFPADPFIMDKNDVQNTLQENGASVFSVAAVN